jgi:prephenate dehydrogenase
VRIAIIGGAGKMGRWFANFFLKDGEEVIISGRNEKRLLEARKELGGVVEVMHNVEAVENADVVIVSVPIDSFEEVIEQISPYTRSGQSIIDITSIKAFPVETMHKHIKTASVLGTHPMFGPGARSMKNQNFVLTPTTEDEQALAEKVREHLEARGGSVTMMSPQEHDEIVAVVLGLSHFIGLVSADTLLSFDKFSQMRAIAGTTYKVLLTLAEGVVSRDAEFYANLQMYLPNITEIEEAFQRSSKSWADLVKKQDKQEFIQRMNNLRNKFEKYEPDVGKAYEKMYKLVEGM